VDSKRKDWRLIYNEDLKEVDMIKGEEKSRRMREQRWLINKVIQTTGPDLTWGMSSIAMARVGPNVTGDVMSIRANVKKYADISREYARVATKREAMAKKAYEKEHFVTARDNYFAAAVFYGMAMWPIHEDDNELNIAYSVKKNECYDKYIEHAPYSIERVEIPFDGKSLPGLLHLPPNQTQKVPCIYVVNGMDGFKEQTNPVYDDMYLARGMAVFVLDIPGVGESLIRKIRCTADNISRAGQAALDYLTTHPEIDPDKIAVTGPSSGSMLAMQVAANDHRFKAVAGRLFCYEPGFVSLFSEFIPLSKARYMWMAGYDDEGEFDKFAETLTTKGLGAKIKCPVLIVGGEDDELSPLEYSYDLYNEITTPKKMMVYKGQGHALPASSGDSETNVADWLRDRLDGKPMQSEIVYIDMMGQENRV
jgi:cephalosporin-C deacetylase-like acetyl esterase